MSYRSLKLFGALVVVVLLGAVCAVVGAFLLLADTEAVAALGVHVGLTPKGFFLAGGLCVAGALPGLFAAFGAVFLFSDAVSRNRAELLILRDINKPNE